MPRRHRRTPRFDENTESLVEGRNTDDRERELRDRRGLRDVDLPDEPPPGWPTDDAA